MKSIVKSLVKGSFLERPLRHIYTWYCHQRDKNPLIQKNYQYDKEVEKLMARILKKDSVCVDVGCARGVLLREMIYFAPRAKHYAFEPIPINYEYLVKEFEKKAHVFPIALGQMKGESKFHFVKSDSGYSGLQEREYATSHEDIEIISVKVDTMDSVIDLDVKIDFIKIDVEGGEYDVLVGAKDIITTHKPCIVFEFQKGAADRYGVSPEKIYDLLVNTFGYNIFLMKDWLDNKPPVSLQKFQDYFENKTEFYFMAHSA
jgi:FkbM family methyltransferase